MFSPQVLVERIAVVGAVPDHSFWLGSCEALLDGSFDELRFCREALAMLQATGRPWRSGIAMILLPFPRRVGPIAAPPFSPLPPEWLHIRLRAMWSACTCVGSAAERAS